MINLLPFADETDEDDNIGIRPPEAKRSRSQASVTPEPESIPARDKLVAYRIRWDSDVAYRNTCTMMGRVWNNKRTGKRYPYKFVFILIVLTLTLLILPLFMTFLAVALSRRTKLCIHTDTIG